MSVHVTSAVWHQSNAEGTARLVLLRLADQANDDGWCWPSLEGLSSNCRVSVASAQRALIALQKQGEIARWRRGRKQSNVYRVLVGTPAESAPPDVGRMTPYVIGQSDRSLPDGDRSSEAPVIGHSCDQRTVIEPSVERTSKQVLSRDEVGKVIRRKPDPLWDALAAEMGRQPETSSERGRWNHALKELRDAGASASDVQARSREYRRRWPKVEFTPTALAANWGTLGTVRTGPVERALAGLRGER